MCKGSSTNTVTQNAAPPQYVQTAEQNAYNYAQTAASNPYETYEGNLVAGMSPEQTQAINTIDQAQTEYAPYGNAAEQYLTQGAALGTGYTNTAAQAMEEGTGAASSYLNNAGQMVESAYGAANPYLNAASQDITAATQPISASTIEGYESPYNSQVVQATQAEINNQNQQQQEQLEGNAISSGAFGNDRMAVTQSALANQQDLAENETVAGLNNQNYAQALSAAQTQNSMGLEGGFELGNLGQTALNAGLSTASAESGLANSALGIGSTAAGEYGTLGTNLYNMGATTAQDQSALGTTALNNTLTGAEAQFSAGTAEQQQQQNILNAAYQQWLGEQEYPFQTSQFYSQAVAGTAGLAGGSGSTEYPSPSPVSQAVGLGEVGLGAYNAIEGTGSTASEAVDNGDWDSRGGRVKGHALGGPIHREWGGEIPGGETSTSTTNPGFNPQQVAGDVNQMRQLYSLGSKAYANLSANAGETSGAAVPGGSAASSTAPGFMGATSAAPGLSTGAATDAAAASPALDSGVISGPGLAGAAATTTPAASTAALGASGAGLGAGAGAGTGAALGAAGAAGDAAGLAGTAAAGGSAAMAGAGAAAGAAAADTAATLAATSAVAGGAAAAGAGAAAADLAPLVLLAARGGRIHRDDGGDVTPYSDDQPDLNGRPVHTRSYVDPETIQGRGEGPPRMQEPSQNPNYLNQMQSPIPNTSGLDKQLGEAFGPSQSSVNVSGQISAARGGRIHKRALGEIHRDGGGMVSDPTALAMNGEEMQAIAQPEGSNVVQSTEPQMLGEDQIVQQIMHPQPHKSPAMGQQAQGQQPQQAASGGSVGGTGGVVGGFQPDTSFGGGIPVYQAPTQPTTSATPSTASNPALGTSGTGSSEQAATNAATASSSDLGSVLANTFGVYPASADSMLPGAAPMQLAGGGAASVAPSSVAPQAPVASGTTFEGQPMPGVKLPVGGGAEGSGPAQPPMVHAVNPSVQAPLGMQATPKVTPSSAVPQAPSLANISQPTLNMGSVAPPSANFNNVQTPAPLSTTLAPNTGAHYAAGPTDYQTYVNQVMQTTPAPTDPFAPAPAPSSNNQNLLDDFFSGTQPSTSQTVNPNASVGSGDTAAARGGRMKKPLGHFDDGGDVQDAGAATPVSTDDDAQTLFNKTPPQIEPTSNPDSAPLIVSPGTNNGVKMNPPSGGTEEPAALQNAVTPTALGTSEPAPSYNNAVPGSSNGSPPPGFLPNGQPDPNYKWTGNAAKPSLGSAPAASPPATPAASPAPQTSHPSSLTLAYNQPIENPTLRHQLLPMIRQAESSDNYGAQNSSSTASGAYQDINATWREGVKGVGLDPAQFPTAKSAPQNVQDKVNDYLLRTRGVAPWTSSEGSWGPVAQKELGVSFTMPKAPSGGAPLGTNVAGNPPTGGANIDTTNMPGWLKDLVNRGGQEAQGMNAAAPQNPVPQTTRLEEIAENPWMGLIKAGLATMGGTSPFAAANIGRGGEAGIDYLQSEGAQQRARQQLQLGAQQQNANRQMTQREQQLKAAGYTNDQISSILNYQQQLPALQRYNVGQAGGLGGPPVPGQPAVAPTTGSAPVAGSAALPGLGAGRAPVQSAPMAAPAATPAAAPQQAAAVPGMQSLPASAPATPAMAPDPISGASESFNQAFRKATTMAAAGYPQAEQWLKTYGPEASQPQRQALAQTATASNTYQQQANELIGILQSIPVTGAGAGAINDAIQKYDTVARVLGLGQFQNPGGPNAAEKLRVQLNATLTTLAGKAGGAQLFSETSGGVPNLETNPAALPVIKRSIDTAAQKAQAESTYVNYQVQNGLSDFQTAEQNFNKQYDAGYWQSRVTPFPVPSDTSQLRTGYVYTSDGKRAFMWNGRGWTNP